MKNTVLTLKDIVKSYADGPSRRMVLNHVDLDVAAEEFVAIVGPSGCGKSTLLNIAGMMLSADAGEIFLCGQKVSDLPQKRWTAIRREKIGFIFQNHQLLPYLKAGEQLSVLMQTDDATVRELFRELNIEHVIDQFPAKLSGGERQRVAIARAFASDGDLILADEPTASLDSERGRHAVEMIRMEAHKRGKGAVMVPHDARVLDLVDRIYKMEDGQLSEVG
ncbi:ABC transporter ATP-binding protein [Pseudoramibacter porci]|uniref:Putative hemin import ATP-binding protein HrtA n=1 Tax=Pseudoramibacter porci TaxID=2606631 RepID=A0A7X2TA54_9FIRM|nr:ABC transporter ATP-binding protein [Pseudoramibacter porci]